ncbi:MAG: hypothetical protein RLZZ618_2383 [Pseudomonadota bacterium]
MIRRMLSGGVVGLGCAAALMTACMAAHLPAHAAEPAPAVPASAPAAASAPALGRFQVRAVEAPLGRLAIAVADVVDRDIVLGPGLSQSRVTLDESFDSFEAFIEAIQRRNGATVLWVGGTPLLGSPCMSRVHIDIAKRYGHERITLLFQDGEVNSVLGLVQEIALPNSVPVVPALQPLMPIGVRMKKVEVAQAAALLATATAMDARAGDDGILRYGLPDERRSCFAGLREGPTPLPDSVARAARVCLHKGKSMKDGKEVAPRCEHLERYRMSELTLRALVQVQGKTHALVEAAEAGLYRVSQGNYMGADYGRIMRIDMEGLKLREIKADQDGEFQEVPRWIGLPRSVPAR